MSERDIIVIGAGPAGISAACLAAQFGLRVSLLDEQDEPGGQIYRSIESVRLRRPKLLGHLGPEYAYGARLAETLRSSAVDYIPGALVWNVDRDLTINFSRGGASRELKTKHVILATGAIERPVPVRGWTLPGVVTLGALQILLKAHGLVPEGRVVLAGSGPLLLQLAVQYIAVGAKPSAIVETVPASRYAACAGHLLSAFRAPEYLRKGLAMMRAVRAAGVPVYRGASGLRIEGQGQATALAFDRYGRRERLPADIVALHQGLVPNQQVTRLLGCEHDWDAAQRCFRPRLDDWFRSSVEGVSMAGDGAGIGGARAAEVQGRLAALGAAERLGRIASAQRDREGVKDRAALRRELAVRPLLDALYAPVADILNPTDEVVACRCEEVTAGQIRSAVRIGCSGPNQAKSFLRCGMGPCQGRLCGLTVTEIIANARGVGPEDVGYFRIRPPLKPIALRELAALDETPAEVELAE